MTHGVGNGGRGARSGRARRRRTRAMDKTGVKSSAIGSRARGSRGRRVAMRCSSNNAPPGSVLILFRTSPSERLATSSSSSVPAGERPGFPRIDDAEIVGTFCAR